MHAKDRVWGSVSATSIVLCAPAGDARDEIRYQLNLVKE